METRMRRIATISAASAFLLMEIASGGDDAPWRCSLCAPADSAHLMGYSLCGVTVKCSVPELAHNQYFGLPSFQFCYRDSGAVIPYFVDSGAFYRNPDNGLYVYDESVYWRIYQLEDRRLPDNPAVPAGDRRFKIGIYQHMHGYATPDYPVSILFEWAPTTRRTTYLDMGSLTVDYSLDHDNDGATVEQEILMQTDPFDTDTNDDGINDGDQYAMIQNGAVLSNSGVCADADNDHVVDVVELLTSSTVSDDVLSRFPGTRTNYPFVTSPKMDDSDGDRVLDGWDRQPTVWSDTDGNGLADDWSVYWTNEIDEQQFAAIDPATMFDGTSDPDGDGLVTSNEFLSGTSPIVSNGSFRAVSSAASIVIDAQHGSIVTGHVEIALLGYCSTTMLVSVVPQPWLRADLQEHGRSSQLGGPAETHIMHFGERVDVHLYVVTSNLEDDATYHSVVRAVVPADAPNCTNDIAITLRVGASPDARRAPSMPRLLMPLDAAEVTAVRSNELEWTAATNANGSASHYDVYLDCQAGSSSFLCEPVTNTIATQVTIPRLHYGQRYYWRVAAVDTAQNMSTLSEVFMFETPPNEPAVWLSLTNSESQMWFSDNTGNHTIGLSNAHTGDLEWNLYVAKPDDYERQITGMPMDVVCEGGGAAQDMVIAPIATKAAFENNAWLTTHTSYYDTCTWTLECGGYFPSLLADGWSVTPTNGNSNVQISAGFSANLSWCHEALPGTALTSTWQVFFGTTSSPPQYASISSLTGQPSCTVPVGRYTTYYWSVETTVGVLGSNVVLASPVFYFSTSRDVYVSRRGGDDAAAGTRDAPFATIQHAIDAVISGGNVWLAGGTYHESVTVSKPVVISSLDTYKYRYGGFGDRRHVGYQTVKNTVIAPPAGHRAFTILSQGVTVERITVSGGGLIDVGGGILCSGQYVNPLITRCVFDECRAETLGGAVAAIGGASPRMTSCIFVQNRSKASGGAVGVSGAGSAVQIAHCTFAKNFAKEHGGAVALESSGTGHEIVNSIFFKNSVKGGDEHYYASGSSSSTITNNAMAPGGLPSGNLLMNPLFSGRNKYHLEYGKKRQSPCRDIGSSTFLLGSVPVDIDGEPFGSLRDIGADEICLTNDAQGELITTELAGEIAASAPEDEPDDESVSSTADPLDDADGDGVCNFDEFTGGSALDDADSVPLPVAEWRFDNAWMDSSGWDQQLEAQNGAGFGAGKVGGGYSPNGGWAAVASTNLDMLAMPRGLSIAGWIVWTNLGGTQTILMKGSVDQPNYALEVTDFGALQFRGGATTVTSPSNVILQGSWTHVGAVAKASVQAMLYVNGRVVAWDDDIGAFPTNGDTVVIGANSAHSAGWQGAIDEIVVYHWKVPSREITRWYGQGLAVAFREAFDGDWLDPDVWVSAPGNAVTNDQSAGWVDDWYCTGGELNGEVNKDRTYMRFRPGVTNNYAVEYRGSLLYPTGADLGFYFSDGRYLSTIGGFNNTTTQFGRCDYPVAGGRYIFNNTAVLKTSPDTAPTDCWATIEVAQHDGEISVMMTTGSQTRTVFRYLDPAPEFGDGMAFYVYSSQNLHDDLTVRKTLMADWRFEGTLVDSSEFGHDGSWWFMSPGTHFASGIDGAALSTESGSVVIPKETGLLGVADRMTIQAWICPSEGCTGIACGVMSKWDRGISSTSDRGYWFGLSNMAPVLRIATTGGVVDAMGGTVQASRWTLLTAAWDLRMKTAAICTNGGRAASAVITGVFRQPSSRALIGDGFRGRIDSARVFAWPLGEESHRKTAQRNLPPDVPHSPQPFDGATNQPPIFTLSWACADPDGDPVRYDVLMGTDELVHLATDTMLNSLAITNTICGVTWQWKVIARDSLTNETVGDLWTFERSASDDWDGDGLSDEDELTKYGTDPLSKDSDGDGSDDGDEVARGADPLDQFVRPVGIISGVMRNAQTGRSYSEYLRAVGGVPPYLWANNGGTLPPGVALYGNGALRGMPTTTGMFIWTAKVTDARQDSTNATIGITVQPWGSGLSGKMGRGTAGRGAY